MTLREQIVEDNYPAQSIIDWAAENAGKSVSKSQALEIASDLYDLMGETYEGFLTETFC